jgi:hypothetical protein
MIMINGGQTTNVHWDVLGAITLGADSVASGNMNSGGVFSLGTGTIFTFGDADADATWTFNIGGALTTEADSKVLTYLNTVIWNVVGAITLGVDFVAKGEINSRGTISVGSGASPVGFSQQHSGPSLWVKAPAQGKSVYSRNRSQRC